MCSGPARVWKGQHAPYLKVSCPECGDYGVTLLGLTRMRNAAPQTRARIRAELGRARREGYRVDIGMGEGGEPGTRRGRMRKWATGD